jgi:hypothetical protein
VTNNHSLCQSKKCIVENSLSKKIISFNNLYNSIQHKYKEAQEKKNFDTIYNTNEGKVSKSKSIFSTIEFTNKTINANSNKNKNKKQLKNKRNILNSDERRKKTFHNSIKNFNENNKNNNNKNVKTGPNYLNKKVKVKSKNNSNNNSKLNIIGYETHNSKKLFVNDVKNTNYNTNYNSNYRDKPVKNKNNKIKSKNVILHNKKESKNVSRH